MSRELIRTVQGVVSSAAQQTAGFLEGEIVEEVSPGRWSARLPGGAVVVPNPGDACFTPAAGIKARIANSNGILTIDGASGG